MRKIVFLIIVAMILIAGCNKQQSPSDGIGPPLIINGEKVFGVEWSGESCFISFYDDNLPRYHWPVADDKIVISMGYDDGWDPSKHGLYFFKAVSPSDDTDWTDKNLWGVGRFISSSKVNAHSVVYHWSDLRVESEYKETCRHGGHFILTPHLGVIYVLDNNDKMNQNPD